MSLSIRPVFYLTHALIVLAFSLVFASESNSAQTSIQSAPALQWSKTFDADRNNWGITLVTSKDEEVYVLLEYLSTLVESSGRVYRISPNGKEIWTRNIEAPDNFKFYDIVAHPAGGILLLGLASHIDSTEYDLIVRHYDLHGSLVQQHRTSNVPIAFYLDALISDDGELFVAVQDKRWDSNREATTQQISIYKFDRSLKFAWSKPISHSRSLSSVRMSDNSKQQVYVSGLITSGGVINSEHKIGIWLIEPDATFSSSVELDYEFIERFVDIAARRDGGALVMWTTYRATVNLQEVWITAIDENNLIEWETRIDQEEKVYYGGIKMLDDGGAVAMYVVGDNAATTRTKRLDTSSGSVVSTLQIDDTRQFIVTSKIGVHKDSIYATGFRYGTKTEEVNFTVYKLKLEI